jgi:hypothetical protein
MEQICYEADLIVRGEVVDVYFTDVDARACIYYDFRILEVLRGDLGAGDLITVSHYGGYVRGSVYSRVYSRRVWEKVLPDNPTDRDLVRYEIIGHSFPAVGDQYVLAIKPQPFTEGAYTVHFDAMGRYFVYRDVYGGVTLVWRAKPYMNWFKEDKFPDVKTLDELRELVASTPLNPTWYETVDW